MQSHLSDEDDFLLFPGEPVGLGLPDLGGIETPPVPPGPGALSHSISPYPLPSFSHPASPYEDEPAPTITTHSSDALPPSLSDCNAPLFFPLATETNPETLTPPIAPPPLSLALSSSSGPIAPVLSSAPSHLPSDSATSSHTSTVSKKRPRDSKQEHTMSKRSKANTTLVFCGMRITNINQAQYNALCTFRSKLNLYPISTPSAIKTMFIGNILWEAIQSRLDKHDSVFKTLKLNAYPYNAVDLELLKKMHTITAVNFLTKIKKYLDEEKDIRIKDDKSYFEDEKEGVTPSGIAWEYGNPRYRLDCLQTLLKSTIKAIPINITGTTLSSSSSSSTSVSIPAASVGRITTGVVCGVVATPITPSSVMPSRAFVLITAPTQPIEAPMSCLDIDFHGIYISGINSVQHRVLTEIKQATANMEVHVKEILRENFSWDIVEPVLNHYWNIISFNDEFKITDEDIFKSVLEKVLVDFLMIVKDVMLEKNIDDVKLTSDENCYYSKLGITPSNILWNYKEKTPCWSYLYPTIKNAIEAYELSNRNARPAVTLTTPTPPDEKEEKNQESKTEKPKEKVTVGLAEHVDPYSLYSEKHSPTLFGTGVTSHSTTIVESLGRR